MELRTPRLHLRRLQPGDAPSLCAYRSLPAVARYQSWESFEIADAERLIASQAQVAVDTPDTWIQLALTLIDSNAFIGDCGIHFLPDGLQVELGITLSPAHQGKGFAAEALSCVMDHLFGTMQKHRVIATVDAENHAAASLFRRLGFRQEAHFVSNIFFKGAWGSEFAFAILRQEWQAARR